MRKRKLAVAPLAALLLVGALPAWTQDLATIKKALDEKYSLTVPTADKTDIVTAGSVLVLKKDHLVTVDVKNQNLYKNTYQNGSIIQKNGFAKGRGFLKNIPGVNTVTNITPGISGTDRTFVHGEKLWVTAIDVKESGIVFTLFTDAFSDVRYGGTLTFPFEKGTTPDVAAAIAQVSQVFDIQPADDAKTQGPAQPAPAAGSQAGAGAPAPSIPPKQAVEVAPPVIVPPPPPPADPISVSVGQTIDQVVAALGQPKTILKPTGKKIYVYNDMKVTFVNGKVTDIQ